MDRLYEFEIVMCDIIAVESNSESGSIEGDTGENKG